MSKVPIKIIEHHHSTTSNYCKIKIGKSAFTSTDKHVHTSLLLSLLKGATIKLKEDHVLDFINHQLNKNHNHHDQDFIKHLMKKINYKIPEEKKKKEKKQEEPEHQE